MEVTIFQINGRVDRLSNVSIIFDDDQERSIKIRKEKQHLRFNKDLIAQIKIGGQHEYKKG